MPVLPPRPSVTFVVLGSALLSAAALVNIMSQDRGDSARTDTDTARLLAKLDSARSTAAGPAIAPPGASQSPQTVRDIERELASRGYTTGSGDGAVTLVTRAAILAFEHDNGLALTAEPSPALLRAILFGGAPAAAAAGGEAAVGRMADQVVRTAQSALAKLGHLKGNPAGLVQGHLDRQTVLAIKAFELGERLTPTGRVSGDLIQRLERRAALGQLSPPR